MHSIHAHPSPHFLLVLPPRRSSRSSSSATLSHFTAMAGQALVAFFLCLLARSELMPSNTHLPNATRSDTTYGLDVREGSMSQLAQKSASACAAFFYERVNLLLGHMAVLYFYLQFNAAAQTGDSASHTGMCQKLFVRCPLPSTPSLVKVLCRMRITRSVGYLQVVKEILRSRRCSSTKQAK